MSFGMTSGKLSIQSPPYQHVTWEVPDFFQMPSDTPFAVESPEFRFAGDRYRLRFYPNGCLICISRDLVAIELEYLTGGDISFELGLKSRIGKEVHLNRCDTPLTGVVFPFERSRLEENRDLFVPDGILTVVCSMRMREPSSAGSLKSEEAETPDKEQEQEGLPSVVKLQSDYRNLLQKGAESDASLVVSGKEFRAHRCVLRTRSAVFEAMFDHETAEKETGRVVINDLDPESFGDFLEYLYTGRIGEGLSEDNVFGLYAAADKYDVPTLKSECVAHMCRNLSTDSFCDVMTVALRHREEDLLQRAVRFFKLNLSRIIVTVKWQQFLKDNSTSANELLIKALVPEDQ